MGANTDELTRSWPSEILSRQCELCHIHLHLGYRPAEPGWENVNVIGWSSSHFSRNTEQQWENGSICWWWQGRTEHVSRITVTRLLHCDISSVSLPFIANYGLNSTVNRQPGSTSREKKKDLVLSSLEQRRETGAAGGNIAIKLDCREHNDLSCWDKLFIGLVWQVIIR